MMEDHDPTSPLGLLNFGWEFAEAAKKVAGEPELQNVAYYLICHAVELALKSYLRLHGWGVQDLANRTKIGHDLETALREADQLGLRNVVQIGRGFENSFIVLNVYYSKKDFEYPFLAPGLPSLYSPVMMDEMLNGTDDLLKSLQAHLLKMLG